MLENNLSITISFWLIIIFPPSPLRSNIILLFKISTSRIIVWLLSNSNKYLILSLSNLKSYSRWILFLLLNKHDSKGVKVTLSLNNNSKRTSIAFITFDFPDALGPTIKAPFKHSLTQFVDSRIVDLVFVKSSI